ncbi:hypothetical protein Tco_0320845 [Tanacetum coccineum]
MDSKNYKDVYGDYKPTIKNKDIGEEEVIPYEKFEEIHKKMISKNDEAKMVLYNALPRKEYERIFMCRTAKDIWNSLIITHQGNKQVKDNIDLFVQKYEEFVMSDDETIDCAFARFNTIITSLKALDECFSSRNHVRKFLRAFPTKWRPKVTAIEESKDLSTLPLDELIGNLKVNEIVLENDSKASKIKKEKYKSLALKARKVSSDEEESCSGSDEEYAMAIRGFKKFFRRRGKFVCQPYEDKKNLRKAFVGGCWSDSEEEDDSKKDKICLMALNNNENSKKIKKGLGFTEDRASTSEAKTEKLGQETGKLSTVEPAELVPSTREPTSLNVGNRPSAEVRLKVKLEPDEWIKDSGCSRHMTRNKDLLSTYEAISGEKLSFNLLSIGQICDKKCKVLFSETSSEILKDGITIDLRNEDSYICSTPYRDKELNFLTHLFTHMEVRSSISSSLKIIAGNL